MSKLAYLRVSTEEQSIENQKMKMKELGIERFFIDEAISGTVSYKNRQGMTELLDYVRDIDVVYVVSLDRLSRDSKELEQIQSIIKSKGATILPLDILEKLNMTKAPDDAISRMIFNVITEISTFYAENERVRMLERQELGIQRAKAEGKYLGGKAQYTKDASGRKLIVYKQIFSMLANGNSVKIIADTLNISRNTVYSIRKRVDKEIEELAKRGLSKEEIATNLNINVEYIDKIIA